MKALLDQFQIASNEDWKWLIGEFEHAGDFTVLFVQTKDKQALISSFEDL